ncbi:MAG TPA: hypothetical protein VHL11_10515, partial [Phototrophicaceae bacterium]|nr:hypothetical protein [Phototrophicaceae bacterium]
MSNRNDFDFDDDPFGSDDSFDSFDDDEGGLDSFEDLDENDDAGSFLDDDEPAATGSGGPNRAFIFVAGLMIVMFLLGLGLILYLATRTPPTSDIDVTRTAIAQINATRIADITNTAVQNQIFAVQTQTQDALSIGQTQTQDALSIAQTQTAAAQPTITPTPSPSLTLEITNTPEGGVGQQDLEATFAAATGIALTGTAENQPTLSGPGTLSANDVLLTATALFLTLNPQTPGPGTEVATIAVVTPNGFPTPTPNELPQTGLFDGFASGQGMGTL